MSILKHHTGTPGNKAPEHHTCTMSELYVSLEKFNKESKKANLQKICDVSFEEAWKQLGKNLGALEFDSLGAKSRDEPVLQTEIKQQPVSIAEELHHSLLVGSTVPLDQLLKSQQRLAHFGIPSPGYSFPYAFRTDEPMVTLTLPPFRKRLSSATAQKFLLSPVTPETEPVFEDKLLKFFSKSAGKQFTDLADLEWRYFKGLARWGRMPRKFSFMNIEFDSEKRFVESQDMPGFIFPPLVRKTLVFRPQVDSEQDDY